MTKRERRQLERLKATVRGWWATVPPEHRQPCYQIADLARRTRTAAKTLGPALRELGWLREQVRLEGIATAVWVPPGSPSVAQPRGRPSYLSLVASVG